MTKKIRQKLANKLKESSAKLLTALMARALTVYFDGFFTHSDSYEK